MGFPLGLCCSCAALSDKSDALQFAAHWDFRSISEVKTLSAGAAKSKGGIGGKEGKREENTTGEGFSFRLKALLCSTKKVYVTHSILRDQWGGCGLTSEHKDTSCLICKRKKHVQSPKEEHV